MIRKLDEFNLRGKFCKLTYYSETQGYADLARFICVKVLLNFIVIANQCQRYPFGPRKFGVNGYSMTSIRSNRLSMEETKYPEEAPPDYDLVMSSPDFDKVPPPPEYEPPTLQGVVGVEWTQKLENPVSQIPRLVYADFLPKCRVEGNHKLRILPVFEDFTTLMSILNDWLMKNPAYQVVRAESIERKVDQTGQWEFDSMLYFQAAFGKTTYIRGIRVWLVPNVDQQPPQQLWYMNVLPKCRMVSMMNHSMYMSRRRHCHHMASMYIPQFENLDATLAKVNEKLAAEALPGSILTVECVDMKYSDFFKPGSFNPDEGHWTEEKADMKIFITMLRMFFVRGQPSPNQEIGFEDFAPACMPMNSRLGKPKFEEYPNLWKRASEWLQTTQGIRVTNLQTVNCRVSLSCFNAEPHLDTKKTYAIVGGESISVNVLRVAYLKKPQETQKICLTSRAFLPVRKGPKDFESMWETVQRINAWLHFTGVKVIGVDTIILGIDPMVKREINPEETRQIVYPSSGQHWLSVIRLYFDGEFVEPPESDLPPACKWTGQEARAVLYL
ncbi:hypothetical protein CAPTEDRAFT_228730 [Capitella teleta]|uniref:Uncharacterized protein n=1 Tax=Capitella teleta TaxID=283909 RepID=R7TDY9_CAPTE|nr:hypothetical protein CAPTEDRAFT_228730 [Capitella teleta]|eukprot:ELT91973.1 hypothetical protein CAPTEDRAFT_228730 [Capitella teleta]